jgi:hypothetical protein
MPEQKIDVAELTKEEWRELGFYYDLDERPSVNSWRFYGSKVGLAKFVQLINDYISKSANNRRSEHEHYGPYMYLKLMTWNEPCITGEYIAGSLNDLRRLQELVSSKLDTAIPGQTFEITGEYGINNTVSARFFVMAEDFDPVSLDELIVSGRQAIVNNLNSPR